jgi:RNA polymerase sigma-70 factor (ECF subfamily)
VWETSDEALLAGYATGDREAATVFVRRFEQRVFGLALSITRSRAEAHDVAQDAFVRAFRYAAGYDPRRGSVVGWLLTIVRNVAVDRMRVTARRPELPLDVVAEWATGDPDTGDLAGEHDDEARALAAVRELPPEQREALLAVTVMGLSAREYSESAGVPLGTAKGRIRLGLQKLRGNLKVVER